MVMQMLTGREVLRTHFPWQLMLKHSMWMAFQHRRELQGFDERERGDEVMLNAAMADPSDHEESDSGDDAQEVESASAGPDVGGPGLRHGVAAAAAAESPGLCPEDSAGKGGADAEAMNPCLGHHADAAAETPGLCPEDPADKGGAEAEAMSPGQRRGADAAAESPGLCPGDPADKGGAEAEAMHTGSCKPVDACTAQAEFEGGAAVQPERATSGKVRLRLQTDTFYDDYLHRGATEPGLYGCLVDTPLRSMSYYTYAMWVRVVEGDPDSLASNQYAFAAHHAKYANYVQELRKAPVIPFLHGFTMPTREKDAETNACFKQVLLRPHRCHGKANCRGIGFTSGFCEPRQGGPQGVESVSEYSYVPCWLRYIAEQMTLAGQADAKLHEACMWPVPHDVTSLRQWWVPGSVSLGCVHEVLAPLLCGHAAHPSDSSLRGVWVRRLEWASRSGASDSSDTASHMEAWRDQRQQDLEDAPCFRLRLPHAVAWLVLRFAGHVQQEDGSTIGIAGSVEEVARLRALPGLDAELAFTCPGAHDLQLTMAQFLALRHVEAAARLEYMAEARGRPRPGQLHPDAEQDDPDGVQGGDRDDNDGEFEEEEKLPGGDGEAEDAAAESKLDPDFDYRPRWAVQDDEMEDVVHRKPDAERHARSKDHTAKKELLQTFLKDHVKAYASAAECRRPVRRSPNLSAHSSQDVQSARAQQSALFKSRRDDGAAPASKNASAFPRSPQAAQARPLRPEDLPRSPIDVTTELIATSGVWRSKEQYLATLFMLQPCQQLWERARRDGCIDELTSAASLVRLTKGMRARRLFLHGPGGSGKTYCLTEVVVKVVKRFFGDRGVKAIAAANSAARLLKGKTMHAAGKMSRKQSLEARKLRPNSRAKKALQREWEYLVLLLGDELGVASPALLAGISRRASHGRKDMLKLDLSEILQQPFGEVLLQALAGDFLQLNPVASHTLMEAFLRRCTVPGVPGKVKEEDEDGYKIFRKICENVVLFTGSHRFLDEDLPKLLEIMRTKGGAKVPQELRAKIVAQIVAGPGDPRLSPTYVAEGKAGFFAFGAEAAIQWEQVARMQQLHVLAAAKVCSGPSACVNKPDGKPDTARHAYTARGPEMQGQLVYYFQAVDKFRHQQNRERYVEALRFVNLSKSSGLMGMLAIFLGMRVRLKKKTLPPELVQEATGEVVGIAFHPKERFGHPGSSNLRPADAHECWQRGWARCDFLPLHIEVRFDGESEDYTGLGKPGVWHLEPETDDWALPVKRSYTIDHPNAPRAKRVKVTAKKATKVDVTRTQVPLAPEFPVTFQGIQGTTVRGPEHQPKGLILDLFRPQTMRGEEREPEYFQHLYMGLGRARKLEWMLLRNFPRDEHGEPDWSIFEGGPPDFLVEFLEALERKAKQTLPKLERAQRELGMPAWADVPQCAADPADKGRYLYDPAAWGRQSAKSCAETPSKRLHSKSPPLSPVSLQQGEPPAASSPKKRRKDGSPKGTGAASSSSNPAPVSVPGLRPRAPRGWWCSLLGRRIGMPLPRPAPHWFNDPACGAVDGATGTQVGLTCGLFAVNHCLARRGVPFIALQEFQERAGDGCYPEGDFDNSGLQRNVEARGCFFEQLQGADHEEAVRQLNDHGLLSVFNGEHALGCVVHMPNPRHWIAVVPPVQQTRVEVAALLCDSLMQLGAPIYFSCKFCFIIPTCVPILFTQIF